MFLKLILGLLIATSFTPLVKAYDPDANFKEQQQKIQQQMDLEKRYPRINEGPNWYTPIPGLLFFAFVAYYFNIHNALMNFFINKGF